MRNAKKIYLGAVLGIIVIGASLFWNLPAYASNIINVSDSGTSLSNALASAKPGDIINIIGTIKSEAVEVPAGVTITGKSGNGKIDFSSTASYYSGRGISIKTDGSTITDLDIYGAADNGIYIEGSNNKLTNLRVHDNKDSGVQLSRGATNNTLTNVYSYNNVDVGRNSADGFAIIYFSGPLNKLIDCTAEGNADDGYDLTDADGGVLLTRCKAISNGMARGIKGDGDGFKLGGIGKKDITDEGELRLVLARHVLINCTAEGNTEVGFDGRNQAGVITMTGCISKKNDKGNYRFSDDNVVIN
ncbi:polysaccharide lyase family 9-like pectate lyase [Clostridium sp. DL-VIII]|uniref:right-handed parallel beta-helix repeat-containing protein n=1 Tax=Clostridium sp. DL-VIII TaxID=641107 RepID=UPI00023B04D0|nr:right-handed parallel beta-helix repeat-containing protein [Clostridium sp. DL-VIII]EHJ00801.1 polysaccharide lyase family 9-like pectate lyase [Clostridium sp. DL-VIII]